MSDYWTQFAVFLIVGVALGSAITFELTRIEVRPKEMTDPNLVSGTEAFLAIGGVIGLLALTIWNPPLGIGAFISPYGDSTIFPIPHPEEQQGQQKY